MDSSAHHPNYPRGVRDDTHFSPLGAELMAREVVDAPRWELRADDAAYVALAEATGAPLLTTDARLGRDRSFRSGGGDLIGRLERAVSGSERTSWCPPSQE